MDELEEFAKTRDDVQAALYEKRLFPDHSITRPVSLADACRMDMSSLAEGGGKVGWPATAWWWYAEDFFRPIYKADVKNLMPKDEEMNPKTDPAFRMPLVGTIDGRRTLTEFWESLGYETLRKERRSGRLAEKKAFSSGFDLPTAPTDEWLGLPKDYLSGKSNAMEICKAPDLSAKMDALLNDLKSPESPPPTSKETTFDHTHPLTQMLLDEKKPVYTEHCLSIGPDDEVAAEILKLQEMLLHQMVMNRTLTRKLFKSALKNYKIEQKHIERKEHLEKEISKCQKVIEAHEKKKREEKTEATSHRDDTALKDESQQQTALKRIPTAGLAPQSTPVALPTSSARLNETLSQPKPETSPPTRSASGVCDICGLNETCAPLLTCSHCGIQVHALCYGHAGDPAKALWWCLPCRIYHERQRDLQIKNTGLKSGGAFSVECKACPNRGGAYQRTADAKKWIHTVCSLALSAADKKAPATIARCCVCGKIKGKVFPCSSSKCSCVLHAFCAKAEGKFCVESCSTPSQLPSLSLTKLLCPSCADKGSADVETEGKETGQDFMDVDSTEVQLSEMQQKKRRAISRLEHHLDFSLRILSDDDQPSGLVADRTRAKRQRTECESKRRGRGRPKNSLNQKKREAEAITEQKTVVEDKESRRHTRSMK